MIVFDNGDLEILRKYLERDIKSKISIDYDIYLKVKNILFESKEDVSSWDRLNKVCFNNGPMNKTQLTSMLGLKLFDALNEKQLLIIHYFYECNNESHEGYLLDLKCEYCNESISKHTSLVYRYSLRNEVVNTIGEINQLFLNLFVDGSSQTILDEIKGMRTQVVPFIGSGISIPFGIPSWAGLLYKLKNKLPKPTDEKFVQVRSQFEIYYNNGDVFGMLDILKNHAPTLGDSNNYPDIFKSIINDNTASHKNLFQIDNNVKDILHFGAKLIITTNYDTILEKFSNEFNYGYENSISWSNMIGVPNLIKEKTIFHLHGSVTFPNDMIVTQDSYDKLYESDHRIDVMQSLMGDKYLLFLGFSLTDKYVVNELERIDKANNNYSKFYIVTADDLSSNDIPEEILRRIYIIKLIDRNIVKKSELWRLGIHLIFMYLTDNIFLLNNDEEDFCW
ncbi:SIR2 family protein [Bacillus pumilus]|uniref:SIR2 family protein n=1 Tax=Bacillus pumilus TaxID=1408 RepID=UPI0011AACC47|nr:SIR2 family protein [Bacillus pumilus]